MKIKMMVSISGHSMPELPPEYGDNDFSFLPGQIVDVADSLAVKWLAGGHAVRYEDPEAAPKRETATLGDHETTMIDHKAVLKKRG